MAAAPGPPALPPLSQRRARVRVRHAARRVAASMASALVGGDVEPSSPGRVDVPLAGLVSPLRYDVVVRAQFFRLVAEHRELAIRDPARFLEVARQSAYWTWYLEVAARRYRPELLGDRDALDRRFARRVADAVALSQSFARRGFDPGSPVVLRRAVAGVTAETGKRVHRDLHMGDGCHRLALLLAAGHTVLPAAWYRVDPTPLTELIDNTAILLPHLGLDEAEYASFLSSAHLPEPVTSLEVLHAAPLSAAARMEVLDAESVDLRWIAGAAGASRTS